MTVRSALAIAAVAASITAFAAPSYASGGQTFDAWGHTYNVPGSEPAVTSSQTTRNSAVQTTGSLGPKRSYTSATAAVAVGNVATSEVRATTVINVWGARINAPSN